MKNIINFYNNESNAPKGLILLMATISGIANAMLLTVINVAASQIYNKALEDRFFIIYLVGLLLFIYAQRYALTQSTIAVEELIKNVRLRLVNKIRNIELRFIESHNIATFYRPLTEDSNAISFAALILVIGSQSVVMLIVVTLYLGYLSITSFVVTIIFSTIALTIYFEHYKKVRIKLAAAYKKETEVFNSISSVLNGFKELKINVITYDNKTSKSTTYFLHFMMKDLLSVNPMDIEYERFADSDGYELKFLNSGEVAVIYFYLNNKDIFLKKAKEAN